MNTRIASLFTGVCFLLILAGTAIAQTAPTPAGKRQESITQHKALTASSLVKALPFRSVGPSVFGGRVADLAVNPDDPTRFFVAYASGGLWQTDNNGTSFTPLFDDQGVITLGDIAVDWQHNIIWAGTGEVNSSRSSYAGNGIYRSTDGGKSWQHLGLDETHHIGRIILHPTDTNTLWVAALGHLYSENAERGIFKTTNGGRSWEKVLYVDTNTGGIDLVIDPGNPDVLYAATWQRSRRAWNFEEAGAGSGIWSTDDGGQTWNRLNTPESGFPSHNLVGRIGLALSTSSGAHRLYAIVDNYSRRPKEEDGESQTPALTKDQLQDMTPETFLTLSEETLSAFLKTNNFPERYTARTVRELVEGATITPAALAEYLEDANSLLFDTPVYGAQVYRSDDRGQTWSKTHEEPLEGVFYSYGYYFGQIRVSHTDPDKIYILGVPALRSDDGGRTFASINGANVHADHHALWVNPQKPGHLILGNDGGVNISHDDGKHWSTCNTPPVGQFYSVALDYKEPYNIYGGLQDNGVWTGPSTYQASPRWQSEGQYPYKRIMGGDGMQVAIDRRDNSTVYTGYQFGNTFRLSMTDEERPVRITPMHDLGERPLRWNWQTPIHLSVHNQDILYIGSQKVHRSLDQGSTFAPISPDLTAGGKKGDVPFGTLSTLHESPLEFGVLYAGSDDGLIHLTRNGGADWVRLEGPWPQGLWVSRVQASSHYAGRVYVSLNGYRQDIFDTYLYVSDDYGKTWVNLGATLPGEPVNVVKEDPVNPDILYVGTDHGAWVSLDGGAEFMPFAGGLPSVPVHDLAVHERDRELVLATHGRSFYAADVSHLQQLSPDLLQTPVIVFDIPDTRYSPSWGARRFDWSEFWQPSLDIPVFLAAAGAAQVTIALSGEDGASTVVFRDTIEAVRGLQYYPCPLTVQEPLIDALRQALVSNAGDNLAEGPVLKTADDGQIYLPPGSYSVTITTDQGEASGSLQIKSGRGNRQ